MRSEEEMREDFATYLNLIPVLRRIKIETARKLTKELQIRIKELNRVLNDKGEK